MKTDIRYVRIANEVKSIAFVILDDKGHVTSIPFTIKEGEHKRVDFMTPSSEQCEYPISYEDYHDMYEFKMEKGELFVAWLNGPCPKPEFSKVKGKQELIDWEFHKARKITTL